MPPTTIEPQSAARKGWHQRKLPTPLPAWGALALAAFYLGFGLLGHDPWKHEDAIGIGIAWEMVNGSLADWLNPHIGGVALREEGPLYHWLAALAIHVARLTGGWIAPHEAARLPAFFCWMASVWLLLRIGTPLYGARHASIGALVFLGSAGLFTRAHQASAEALLVLGVSLVLAALLSNDARRMATSMLLGGMLCMALATAGHGYAIVLGMAMVIGVVRPNARGVVVLALGLAMVAVLAWRLAAQALVDTSVSTDLEPWARAQLAVWSAPDGKRLGFVVRNGMWFFFPAWPLVLAWIWRQRNLTPAFLAISDNDENDAVQGQRAAARRLLFGVCACFGTLLLFSEPSSYTIFLALLPPLALLAGFGMLALRRGAAHGFDWFAALGAGAVAAYLWFYGFAAQTGMPARAANAMLRREPGLEITFTPWLFTLALVCTLAWLWSVAHIERGTPRASRQGTTRGLTRWILGLSLIWVLTMTLWLPSIENGKSFRAVSRSIGERVPANTCAATQAGLSERASLRYFLGQRIAAPDALARCDYKLVSVSASDAHVPGPGWLMVWDGSRRGGRSAQFLLYRKVP